MTTKTILQCGDDENTIAVSDKPITANMITKWQVMLFRISTPPPKTETADDKEPEVDDRKVAIGEIKEFYESLFSEIKIVDINGKEFTTVADCFAAVDHGDVDAAVSTWFMNLPREYHEARQQLGKSKRVN